MNSYEDAYTLESVKKAMLEGRCGSTYEGHAPLDGKALSSLGGWWNATQTNDVRLGFLCKKCLTLVYVSEEKLEYINPPKSTPVFP